MIGQLQKHNQHAHRALRKRVAARLRARVLAWASDSLRYDAAASAWHTLWFVSEIVDKESNEAGTMNPIN